MTCHCLLQTIDKLKDCPAPFDGFTPSFDPDQTLPVSVLHTKPKLMKVGDVKSMSWEQHVDIWKVGCTKHENRFSTTTFFFEALCFCM